MKRKENKNKEETEGKKLEKRINEEISHNTDNVSTTSVSTLNQACNFS
jgi:hypothetical protein